MLYQFFIDANSENSAISARGLLLLFLAGFVPLMVGLDVKSLSIDIPWFIEADIKHPERFLHLYCVMVLYSVYRFYVSNRHTSIVLKARATENFLRNGLLGRMFVNRYVFECGDLYTTKYIENEKSCGVEILGYSESEDGTPTETFAISVSTEGRWRISITAPDWLNHKFCKQRLSWGLVFLPQGENSDDDPYLSIYDFESIPSQMKRTLSVCAALFSFRTLIQDVRFIDFYVPILLNVIFVNYLVYVELAALISSYST